MRFLGRAVLLCALATPGVASATAESFVGSPALGGAAAISRMAPPSMAPPAMASMLREPRLVAGLRDTRMVDDFYRALGYRLAWQGAEGWSEAAHQLVRRLAAADTHGLDPADYAPDSLAALLQAPVDEPGAMRADVTLTVALLRYLDHANNGRIRPSAAGWDVWFHPRSGFVVEAATALASGRLAAYLDQAGPPDRAYGALREVRARFVERVGEDYPLLGAGPTLRPGDRDPEVAIARRQLAVLGDLPVVTASVEPPAASAGQWRAPRLVLTSADAGGPDASDGDSSASGIADPLARAETFDATLERGVQAFQRRHGLTVDGLIGPATRRALDVTPAERLRQIDLGLERLRWMPAQRGERHVIVNIPSAELVAFDRGEERLRMPVVTGQPNWKTPVFSDEIVNLKFAPTWTIPYNIIRDETLPLIRRDPGYLTANSIRVFWQGEEIDPWTVDWYNSVPGDFTLRQDSGASALGGVRFSLTNNFGIYLHDTPAKRYFGRAARALSHGCVRVGDPVELAKFLLEGQGEWDEARIEREMNGAQERFLKLRRPVPVHMVYISAWAENGQAQFRHDVYGYDKRLAEMLAARTAARPS